MAENKSGQWRTTDSKGPYIEHGLQPARVQYQPPVRPSSSQIKPPPPAKKN